jgi:uncharacterized repeat protein (TIGR01451 family)
MSRQGRFEYTGRLAAFAPRAAGLFVAIVTGFSAAPGASAQAVPSEPAPAPAPRPIQPAPVVPAPAAEPGARPNAIAVPGSAAAPGSAVVGGPFPAVSEGTVSPPGPGVPVGVVVEPGIVADPAMAPGMPALAPEVQVVRFQGPPGLAVDVLAPTPVPVSAGDGQGIAQVGLVRGVGYRLRIGNIPDRPGAELFPVIEVVGHLHRPTEIDPGKYPIRVVFNTEDLYDVLDRSRLLTKVIYLEDPDSAIPFRLPKDQIPVLTISPTEPPLQVARALGRPMAIVRMGGRRPADEDLNPSAIGDLGLDWAANLGKDRCPYVLQDGSRCGLPCGPVCLAAPAPKRPILPRDEYLCDGGDRGIPAAPTISGRISGVDPRDAVMRFNVGIGNTVQTRILPTNVVCIYAPRFAEVRVSTGTNQNIEVQLANTQKSLDKAAIGQIAIPPRRLVQNQAAELSRARARATGFNGKVSTDEDSNNSKAADFEGSRIAILARQRQAAELARNRQKPTQFNEKIKLVGIKTAASPVITGITESASEAVKVWGPHAMTGSELPPPRPGLAVVKRVSNSEAEPGDTITYAIIYRNMGNTPIRSVVIVDSLLPRLEYKPGTAKGPPGTVFATAVNRVGSTELRWELPGALLPGVVGHVSFDVIVR